MKILFIDFTLPYLINNDNYPVGGWAIELYNWIYGLLDNNVYVGLITWKGAKKYLNKTLEFEIFDILDRSNRNHYIKYVYHDIPVLLKIVKNYDIDYVIQACSSHYTGIMKFVCMLSNVPFIYRVANDIDIDYRNKYRIKKKIRRALYVYGIKNSDCILVQNRYQYQTTKKKFNKKHIYLLYNPIKINNKITKPRIKASKNFIAWCGIFSFQKNLPLLLFTAEKFPSVKFKIIGCKATNCDIATTKAIESLYSLPNIEFLGYKNHDKIIPILSESLVLLNTSYYEGFSNTFLESFAAGTPVIASKNCDPDDVITNNQLGFAYDNDNQLLYAIDTVINMPDKDYENMVKRCQTYLIENHDNINQAKKLIHILNSIK